MTYTPKERAINRQKIKKYGTLACIDKAIEEASELTEALIALKREMTHGCGLTDIVGAVSEAAMEYSDVVISSGDTMELIFSDLWIASAESKRKYVYESRLPNLLSDEL